MHNTLLVEQALKIASFNGIDIYGINSGKFKTNSINFFFLDNLNRQNVTKNALLPAVLRRGCRKYPTFRDIALRLEELYGSSFDCGVTKKGERHIIQFYIEFLSDNYTSGDSNQFENAFELLYEIINQPVLEKGVFKEDYLEQEKDNLKKLIESRVNDKMQYSLERCFEETCRNEPYSIYDYGFTADLKSIGTEDLYKQYRDMLETYPLQVYLSGDMDEAMIRKVIDLLMGMKRGTARQLIGNSQGKNVREVANVTEKMNITQGKLCLGFRTNIQVQSSDYYTLLVYNGILGGGVHSKLFQNVREKASLAYYVFSRLEKFKGLMVVGSGIEITNRDKALEIIMQQLEEIKKGNITDYEFDSTIKSIETGIKSLKDSQMQIVDFYLSQAVAGTKDSFDDIIANVKKVAKKDIVAVAAGIKLDTIYFLTSADA
jgi:predicted Zn-dependent peptidase